MLEKPYIQKIVANALAEDIGSGDLTAALVNPRDITASLVCREAAVLCGTAFFDEVFRQLDASVQIKWFLNDGDHTSSGQTLCALRGPARPILTGERSALNLLQTLSGTATQTAKYVQAVAGTSARILDTRKTLPGLRLAQKYAVHCGGGHNHRLGLYDGVLIKENHLRSSQSLVELVKMSLAAYPENVIVEVEVTNLDELRAVVEAGAPRVLLDNFSLHDLAAAVEFTQGRTKLEASGGVDLDNIRAVAETGVDFISVGALTKHLRAVDMSLLVDQ